MAPGSAVLLRRFQSPRPLRPKRRARSPREYRAAIRQRGPYWRWRVGLCSCAFSSVRVHGVRLLLERSRFVDIDVEAMKCLTTEHQRGERPWLAQKASDSAHIRRLLQANPFLIRSGESGNARKRLPVSRKTALPTQDATSGRADSPTPPG